MEWNSDFITDSERKIHYYYNSDKTKPPLMLLHGAWDNGLCWIPTANKLAEKYFVIMPDARGHGLTETPKKVPFSFDVMADDVAFLIQKLNLKKPQIIGHSMGANVTTLFASKYPDLVSKIILEDPVYIIQKFPSYSKPLIFLSMIIAGGLQLRGSVEKLMKRGKKKNPTWPEEVFKPWADAKLQYKKNKFYLLGMLNMRYFYREYLQNIKCPVLFISSSGGILRKKKAKEALEICKGSKWVKIEGAKHNIRRDQPDKFMEALNNFLD